MAGIRRGCVVGALILLLGSAAVVQAQWSSDPAVNLVIADRLGEQVQPKIQVTSDGGCYIGWFDNAGGGYDIYLQRLDPQGNALWAHNGILIADRGFSSTQDWDMKVDGGNNALLTFRDDRFADIQITAFKVDPTGAPLWGPNGVQLTSDNIFKASPKIAATSDGEVVVGWTNDNDAKFQRLDSSGTPLWGAGVSLSGSDDFILSDLNASDGGRVIASWVQSAGFPALKHLHAQKLSHAGAEVWASRAVVFDGGSLQFGNFPEFVADGSGGAVFAWYGVSPLQCYVQRILDDGSEAFAHNGVAASTVATRLRVSPSVSFRLSTAEIFLFWPELNSTQSESGIYGQKFAFDGTRMWGSGGRQLVPVDATERTQVRNLQMGDGAMVFWVDSLGFGDDRLVGTRVDGAGHFLWAPSIIEPSTVSSDKSRLAAALTPDNAALLTWEDDRAGNKDLYAQNVRLDGSLGSAACPSDLNNDGSVDAADLAILLGAWGPGAGHVADLNADGMVDAADLALLLGAWGPC